MSVLIGCGVSSKRQVGMVSTPEFNKTFMPHIADALGKLTSSFETLVKNIEVGNGERLAPLTTDSASFVIITTFLLNYVTNTLIFVQEQRDFEYTLTILWMIFTTKSRQTCHMNTALDLKSQMCGQTLMR